mmetsp:Transcript_63392/g.100807  ORF Transcript_63392/g.100807 Transcript_63392/m.100807 type:complete len:206 (+) Transcript_63392:156-773(+)
MDKASVDVGESLWNRWRLIGHANLVHCCHVIVKLPPRVTSGSAHLQNHASKAPNICHSSVTHILHYLGRHPGDRSLERRRQGFVRPLGTTEVCQFRTQFCAVGTMSHQNVGTFNISVKHRWLLRMQISQALEQVFGISGRKAFLKCTKLLQNTGHGAANHVLQVDVKATAYVVMTQVAHNAGMLQLGTDLDFVLQSFFELNICRI